MRWSQVLGAGQPLGQQPHQGQPEGEDEQRADEAVPVDAAVAVTAVH